MQITIFELAEAPSLTFARRAILENCLSDPSHVSSIGRVYDKSAIQILTKPSATEVPRLKRKF